MERFFFWLSGADKDILRRCTNMGQSEKIKLCGLGALVLIPATLGLFSMAYAISTVAPSPFVYVPAGIIWFSIILVIDRYLISTTSKTKLTSRGDHTSLIARYVFAIFVGVAIAHPFVLLWFNSSTVQQIEQNRRDAITERVQQGNNDRAVITGAVPTTETASLLAQRQKQVDYQNCLTTLQQYEQSAAPPISLPCGATTGIPTCAQKCLDITPRITQASKDIAVLDEQISQARKMEQASADEQARQLNNVDTIQAADIKNINGSFSTDYLARVEALSQIAKTHHEVYYVSLFIILLFILVDVLPITMKYATPMGEYEEVRESLLLERRTLEQARRNIIASGNVQKALAESEAAAAKILGEVGSLYPISNQLLEAYTQSHVEFQRKVNDLYAQAGAEPSVQAKVFSDVIAIRKVNENAWDKVVKRVLHYIATV